jgi:hypothetical protein
MKQSILMAVLTAFVAAQSIDDLPACSDTCLADGIAHAGCNFSDIECACAHVQPIDTDITPCLQTSCSKDDEAYFRILVVQICADYGVPIDVPPTIIIRENYLHEHHVDDVAFAGMKSLCLTLHNDSRNADQDSLSPSSTRQLPFPAKRDRTYTRTRAFDPLSIIHRHRHNRPGLIDDRSTMYRTHHHINANANGNRCCHEQAPAVSDSLCQYHPADDGDGVVAAEFAYTHEWGRGYECWRCCCRVGGDRSVDSVGDG